jgi:hypothetical protein
MRRAGWLGALLAAVSWFCARPARAQQAPVGEAQAETRERAALLAQVLPVAVRGRSLVALPPVLMVTGGALGALGIAARSPAYVVSGVLALGGGVGFYFVPEERNYELLAATAAAASGFAYLGLPLPSPHERWQIPLALGAFATSGLGFVNFAYSTNPGRKRLLRDLERVRTPAARSSLDVAELQQIEHDLYATDFAVPQWAMGLPLIVSGVVASAPVFDRDVARRDKPLIGAIAGAALFQGLVVSFIQTPAMQYRSSLQNAGLWVKWGVGPGGVSVTGSFD